MKKVMFLVVASFFVTSICFAQMPSNMTSKEQSAPAAVSATSAKGECPYSKGKAMEGMGGMMGHGMMSGMKGHGMMGGSMMDMKSKMCSCGGASMIASEKGGVIVLLGDDLYKFDKDLNLVKKVELGKGSCFGLPPGHPDISK